MRPYCKEFLKQINKYYEVYIFTASEKLYAESIVDFIDPNKEFISGILSREDCYQLKSGKHIKDLKMIQNRNLKNMVIVDDTVHSFIFQVPNAIPILKWKNDKNDEELKYLYKYLVKIAPTTDLRESNRKTFHLEKLVGSVCLKKNVDK